LRFREWEQGMPKLREALKRRAGSLKGS